MTTVIKDPFTQLDAYDKEAFAWAKGVASKIDIGKLKEKDPIIISTAFARIFDVFIHLAMSYNLTDFGSYLDDKVERTVPNSWNKMLRCTDEIYSAMMAVYKDSMEIYKTLYVSILVEVEDDGYDYGDNKLHSIKIEPYDYKEDKGFGYVCEGFNY